MEKIVYIHRLNSEPYSETVYLYDDKGTPFVEKLSKGLLKASVSLFLAGLLFTGVFYGPGLAKSLKGSAQRVSSLLAQTAKATPQNESQNMVYSYQPSFDPSLPKENRLVISAIGVDGELNEATIENYEEALKKGIWRVADFGTPAARNNPTILAAHRFGYLAWTNIVRRERSFYNLPKLAEGELVEVIWKQRKYVYEVYATSEGEEITDYSADLILYTCENLNSPIRVFKYARLLEI